MNVQEYRKFEPRPEGLYHYGKEEVLGEGHFFGPFVISTEVEAFAQAQAAHLQEQISTAVNKAEADGWEVEEVIPKSAFGADGVRLVKQDEKNSVLILDALGQRGYHDGDLNWFALS